MENMDFLLPTASSLVLTRETYPILDNCRVWNYLDSWRGSFTYIYLALFNSPPALSFINIIKNCLASNVLQNIYCPLQMQSYATCNFNGITT